MLNRTITALGPSAFVGNNTAAKTVSKDRGKMGPFNPRSPLPPRTSHTLKRAIRTPLYQHGVAPSRFRLSALKSQVNGQTTNNPPAENHPSMPIEKSDYPIPNKPVPALSLKDWHNAKSGEIIKEGGTDAGEGSIKNMEEKLAFAEQINQAFSTHGFLALTDHGIEQSTLTKVYQEVERFFSLDESAKNALIGQNRGYIPFQQEHAKDCAAPDLKEFFQVGPGENLYPKEQPSLEPTLNRLIQQLHTIGLDVLSAISLHLGLDEEYLPNLCEGGESILRLLHYPPLNDNDQSESVRAAAHEDINMITLLVTATAKGLQLRVPVERQQQCSEEAVGGNGDSTKIDKTEYEWVNAVVPEGAIIVNLGDMLESFTNGYWKATTHRVVNPEPGDPDRQRNRYSIPYFLHAHNDVSIAPHPSLLEKRGETALYPERTSLEYRTERLREIGLIDDADETLGERPDNTTPDT